MSTNSRTRKRRRVYAHAYEAGLENRIPASMQLYHHYGVGKQGWIDGRAERERRREREGLPR